MGAKIEMIGKKFNMLTVLEESPNRINGKVCYICKCDCGNITKPISGSNLRNGHTKSCGCHIPNKSNLVGQRFGRLTVVKLLDERAYNGTMIYECKCDCGEIKKIRATSLIGGVTLSCGCLQRDSAKERCGENHPNYNCNLTDEEREQERDFYGYKQWVNNVLEREDYTCEKCGKKGGTLNAHHKDGYHWNKERRIDISNGACLCEHCHKEFHNKFGNKYNTEEQYIAFLIEELS